MTELGIPKEPSQPKDIFLPNNVQMTILFSTHDKREDLGDFEAFKGRLRGSDIFIPEAHSWKPLDLNLYRQISQGNQAALRENRQLFENHDHPDFNAGITDALFKSHVKVVIVDVPRESPITERYRSAQLLPANFFKSSFEDALTHLEEYYLRFSKAVREREDYILQQIGISLNQAIQESDKLKKKSHINVLMTIGANHPYVYDRLNEVAAKQRGDNNSALPSVEALYGRVAKDVGLEIIDGLDKGIDVRDLLAKRLARIILGRMSIQGRTLDQTAAAEVAYGLTTDEIRSLFQQFQKQIK